VCVCVCVPLNGVGYGLVDGTVNNETRNGNTTGSITVREGASGSVSRRTAPTPTQHNDRRVMHIGRALLGQDGGRHVGWLVWGGGHGLFAFAGGGCDNNNDVPSCHWVGDDGAIECAGGWGHRSGHTRTQKM
jgi:hypothetical protein